MDKNLTKRLLAGFAGATVLITFTVASSHLVFSAFLFISVMMQYEFNKHVTVNKHASQFLAYFLNIFFSSISYLETIGIISENYFYLLFPLSLLILITSLYDKAEMAFQTSSNLIFGLVYIVLPTILIVRMGFKYGEYNYQIPLAYLLFLWAGDTGSYFAGKSFGKHKLFERISPNKTWEGALGGLVLSIIFATILSYNWTIFSLNHWLIIAALTFTFGLLGDLVESMFKRNIGIKDSGNIIPGHGGFLDRFDGLLLSAPIVYIYIKIFVI